MKSSLRFQVNSPNVIQETIEDEVIIADLTRGTYYSLENVGAAVWNAAVNDQKSVPEIVDALVLGYKTSRLEVEEGINEFMAQLQEEDLIVLDHSEGLGTSHTQTNISNGEPMIFEKPTLHKYTDMEQILLLDPIHDVDETGWPNNPLPSLKENGQGNAT